MWICYCLKYVNTVKCISCPLSQCADCYSEPHTFSSIIDIDDLDLEGLDLKRLKNLKVERGLKVKVENVDIDERESYDNARPRRYYKASG